MSGIYGDSKETEYFLCVLNVWLFSIAEVLCILLVCLPSGGGFCERYYQDQVLQNGCGLVSRISLFGEINICDIWNYCLGVLAMLP